MTMRTYITISLVCSIAVVFAQEFKIVDADFTTQILLDKSDAKVVHIATDLFIRDVESISGKAPKLVFNPPKNSKNLIVAGTLGSTYIRRLLKEGKVKDAKFQGQWENYSIQLINASFKGIESAMVII